MYMDFLSKKWKKKWKKSGQKVVKKWSKSGQFWCHEIAAIVGKYA